MTDLEITRLCAEAMGYKRDDHKHHIRVFIGVYVFDYDPLHDDAQAMALVKEFKPQIEFLVNGYVRVWLPQARTKEMDYLPPVVADGLNRAICECVAKIQQTKEADKRFGQPHYGHDERTPNV